MNDAKDALTLAAMVFILPFLFFLGVGTAAIILKALARSVL